MNRRKIRLGFDRCAVACGKLAARALHQQFGATPPSPAAVATLESMFIDRTRRAYAGLVAPADTDARLADALERFRQGLSGELRRLHRSRDGAPG